MSNLVKLFFIRSMDQSDLEAVIAIEQLNSKSPWSKNQFLHCVEWTQVIVVSNAVVGFAVVVAMGDQAELQNISIHPDHRELGLGEKLLDYVMRELPKKIGQIYLEVRVSNFSAINLYTKIGFAQVGQRRDYYATDYGREDALLMSRSLC